MSDLLSIGASGVRGYQRALGTVSENIANAATVGYSRRSVELTEVGGNGVIASRIVRAGDAQKSAEVRSASADLAKSESGIAWLERIQDALTGNQLGDRLTSFFTAAQSLAADPAAAAPRATMLEAASSVASSFAASGRALDAAAADLDASAQSAVATLSDLATALTKVNVGVGRTAPGTAAAAGLADRRDALLDQMSAIADVSVALDAGGRATVRLGGTAGPVLVDPGSEAGVVSYQRNGEGAVALVVHRAGDSGSVSPSGGALAGIVDGAQRIADARAGLDRLASGFAGGVNAVQAQGRDLDGNAGAPLFAVGATATDLAVALGDPRGIAAASVGGGTRDNGNLAALQAVRSTGGYEAGATDLVADTAATLAARQTVADAQSTIRDGAVAGRDAVSGVSLDDEAVDLLRFQQAYQASSRVIQVSREILQTILEIR